MRLSDQQIGLILQIVKELEGPDAQPYLFGSRTNDAAKGGDVDLFIESAEPMPLLRRARLKMQLESALALPVDLVCKARNQEATAFQTIAMRQAIKLQAPT